jgi:phosphoglycolate phosphatase-like HAD superfamily hydrolase
MKQAIVIFDLDGTVIDSAHRTPNNADGTLNLAAYHANHTPENVAKDKLLPLARLIRAAYDSGMYTVILTARDMKACDYEYLEKHGIRAHKIMSRDRVKSEKHYKASDGAYKAKWIRPFLNLKQFAQCSVVMFDDAAPVKNELRKLFPVLCAHKVNRRLGK